MKTLLITLILMFLTAVIVPVHAQPSAGDVVGVCLDPTGAPSTSCPPYMQIVSIDMATESSGYVGTINLAGGLPSSLGDPNRFIEWGFLIDADRNILTNSWDSFKPFENDIGADYKAGLELQGTSYQPVNASWLVPIQLMQGLVATQIRLIFTSSSIGGSNNFDFVVVAREYAKAGDPTSLMLFDKFPNAGHYSFECGPSLCELISPPLTTSETTSMTTSESTSSTTAPTTTITNLQYPNQVTLQNGAAQATVTFTLHFSGLPPGDHLTSGILYVSTSEYVTGSAASTPDSCLSLAGTKFANSAACVTAPTSSSGIESASFHLTFNATQQYALYSYSTISDKAGNPIGSLSASHFTISVTTSTSSESTSATTESTSESTPMLILGLSIIALPFIVIIGLIIFVVRRRRRKSKRTGGTAAEGLASKPSPAPTTEGTKFCTACGARIPVTAPFCLSCGGKQD